MTSIIVKGKKYDLLFDMWALEQIEEEFGGVKAMFESLNGNNGTSLAKAMSAIFRILANSARDAAGLPTNVTGEEVRHMSIGKLTAAVHQAIDEGMKSETSAGGAADDETHDAYLDEIDRKN